MNNIKAVMDCCIAIMNYRITIEPYTFSFLQFYVALAVLALLAWFFSKLFDQEVFTMGAILSGALTLYIYTLIISMVLAFVRFLRDVRKWHDKEEKVHITASEFEADLNEVELVQAAEPVQVPVSAGEEVTVNDSEQRKCDTPIVF